MCRAVGGNLEVYSARGTQLDSIADIDTTEAEEDYTRLFAHDKHLYYKLVDFYYDGDEWNNYYRIKGKQPLTSISEDRPKPKKSTWRVYPNPAENKLHIESSARIQNLRLMDMQGRMVKQKNYSGAANSMERSRFRLPEQAQG